MTLEQARALAAERLRRGPVRQVEHGLQSACVRWFAVAHGELRGRLFAVPNGGLRSMAVAGRMKAEGVVAGVADMILLKSCGRYGALLIEMKAPGGRQSEAQRRWAAEVTAEDEFRYVVCRSVAEFIDEVESYLSLNKPLKNP